MLFQKRKSVKIFAKPIKIGAAKNLYALVTMKKDERRKLKTGEKIEGDLNMVRGFVRAGYKDAEIVRLSQWSGLSRAYSKELLKRVKRKKLHE